MEQNVVFLSLAQREARAACRRGRLYHVRILVASAFLAAIPLRLQDPRARNDGALLFEAMTWMAFVYCLAAGVFRSCDTLAEEKREGTLGLLLLTDLRPGSVLLGKILSASATTFFGLLAVLPMLAVPVLLGGVTAGQLARVSLCLLNTLFLSTAWGFLISATARKHIVTTLLAFLAPIFFSVVPFLVADMVFKKSQSQEWAFQIGLWTPAAMPATALETAPDAIQYFWSSLAFTHVLAWGYFFLAAYLFPRLWHDIPSTAASARWAERFRRWRFGDAKKRRAIRRWLLRGNPLVWFVNRDRLNSRLLFNPCLALLIAGYFLDVSRCTLVAVNIVALFRMANEASHSVSEDQKNGALELFLSTPMSVAEIIQGRVQALLRQFASSVALIIGWQYAVLNSGLDPQPGFALALAFWLVASWFALAWVGPWFALRAKRPAAATWMSLGAVTLPPLIGWVGAILPSFFDSSVHDVHGMAATICACIGVGHCVLLVLWARQMLFKNFREAAADKFVTLRFETAFNPSPVRESNPVARAFGLESGAEPAQASGNG
jgi:ABC-type Na+ efflux pump permease subunit